MFRRKALQILEDDGLIKTDRTNGKFVVVVNIISYSISVSAILSSVSAGNISVVKNNVKNVEYIKGLATNEQYEIKEYLATKSLIFIYKSSFNNML